MKISDIDMSCSDMHIHSIASDGEMRAEEIIPAASELNLTNISITDHDGMGAYEDDCEKLIDFAKSYGVDLMTGIELDSEFRGVEIHILGYGIDHRDPPLSRYLKENHRQRNKRTRELIVGVNEFYGEEVLKESEIFIPGRETLMKPHLIKVLLNKGLFKSYPDAKLWIRTNIQSGTKIKKPSPDFIVNLIRGAGGEAVIAHPGYYIDLLGNSGIDDLISLTVLSGLSGIEVFYDYASLSPWKFSQEDQRILIKKFSEISTKSGLTRTRGGDAHSLNDFRKRNSGENR